MRHTGVMHPAFLYLPGDRLTLTELSAARLDGHVVELGEGYIPADLVECGPTRAASIASIVPAGCAASGPTAAWVHGAGDAPPIRHHVRRAVTRRIRPAPDRRLVFHDTMLRPEALVRIGGILVTAPVRTMIDLALASLKDPVCLSWMGALESVCPGSARDALTELAASHRVPGAAHASTVLARIAAGEAHVPGSEDQDEVTRYTS